MWFLVFHSQVSDIKNFFKPALEYDNYNEINYELKEIGIRLLKYLHLNETYEFDNFKILLF